jgi:hypothetical protein
MHPLLQTLDQTAGAGTESSVHDLRPIRQAAPAGARALPALLSLGLMPLLIYGLAWSLDSPIAAISRAVSEGRHSVTLLMEDTSGRLNRPAPTRNLIGPEGPGGVGHRDGTSTLDPRLAVVTTTGLAPPSDAIDPDELGPSPRADLASLSLNPALPLQAGGNGLARGTGRDAARGSGGLLRPPAAVAMPDQRLVPTRQVTIQHRLAPGESALVTAVRVRILIGEDGVPLRATIVSGPAYLHAQALKAAYEWRFEPLGAHGLKAPLSLTLTFHPTFQGTR